MAHEARTILDHQDAVAELERLRNFTTYDQLSVRLEQTEEFFAVVDPFPLEHTPSSQVTDMNGHVYVISQLLLEHVYSGTQRHWERWRSERGRATPALGPESDRPSPRASGKGL